MKKAFTLFICLCMLAFLVLAPAAIANGVSKNVFTLLEQEKAGKYQGTLTLWHVVSFKTGGTSGVSFLTGCISRFEKSNPYVFIKLEGLTPAQAGERLAAGEAPDLLSFPLGWTDGTALAQLPADERILPAFAACGDSRAYPYMADAYVLVCNQDLFYERDVPLPLEQTLSCENFMLALDRFSAGDGVQALSYSPTEGLLPLNALLNLNISAADDTLMLEEAPAGQALASFDICMQDGRNAFLDGKAAMYLCPSAEYEGFANEKRANALSLCAYSISNYTDLVQLIGCYGTQDEKKRQMCEAFAQSLISERAQKGMEEMRMLPSTWIEGIYEGVPLQQGEYERLSTLAAIPSSQKMFANAEGLPALIQAALTDDLESLGALQQALYP